ncbi:MAG: 50S ribosomal protein L24e [Candidatus Marsarchaeota archaeon]|jgi:LSU ribosomal protein L24E|nr:50S ribosomal protein L24e [Candidatus Marsarchaeota archaeon]MCL5419662.1 50S ribosomal protein L24e [Candidatus Marsarchaeota archaeon]
MVKCSYCIKEIERGTGLIYVKKNGAIRHYCSDRCYKFNELYGKKASKKEIAANSPAGTLA